LTHHADFGVIAGQASIEMKRAVSKRVAERLRRLREKFGEGIHDHQVDHNQDHLTSTRPEHVPLRTFYLGEIWWVDRCALGDWRPYREGSSYRPALVTRREPRPHEPIEMAPSARQAPGDIDKLCFRATEPPEELQAGTWFLLPYRRPVSRQWLGGSMGALSGRGKQQLAELLGLLRAQEKGTS
jgi:hypothetical protein